MPRPARLLAPLVALAALAVLAPAAVAQDTTRGVRVGITYDPGSRPGVVVLPVAGPEGDSIQAIIARDLDYSDRFTMIGLDAAAGGSLRAPGTSVLNYPLFARMGAVAALQVTRTPAGLHVVLHDVGKAGVARVRDFPLPAESLDRDWRMAVHRAADEVEEWITGTRGIAATRIAFVREAAVRVIDSDGWGETALRVSGEPMSPAWSPDGERIAYSTVGNNSRIMVHDIRTGRSRAVDGTPRTTNLTPSWSPDGESIVYSHANEEGSDLYLIALDAGETRRLSVGRGSDNAQPSFSPDGRRLAFTSGRAGRPQIYIMDADGTNAELLTAFDFGDQNYRSDPDWSPDGRLIAFQSQFAGRFQLMTISLRDRSTRVLTSEGENEQPSWAPDGRHLVFTSSRSGVRQLWVLDVETGRARQLTRAGGSRLGAWSPRIGGQSSR